MEQPSMQAHDYLLICILQRLEEKYPGFVEELSEGVRADMSASQVGPKDSAFGVFNEAQAMVDRALLLNRQKKG